MNDDLDIEWPVPFLALGDNLKAWMTPKERTHHILKQHVACKWSLRALWMAVRCWYTPEPSAIDVLMWLRELRAAGHVRRSDGCPGGYWSASLEN